MEHLFQTFLHSMAWHAGTQLANSMGVGLVGLFIGYGIYRFLRRR